MPPTLLMALILKSKCLNRWTSYLLRRPLDESCNSRFEFWRILSELNDSLGARFGRSFATVLNLCKFAYLGLASMEP